jgi:hypothetical protein
MCYVFDIIRASVKRLFVVLDMNTTLLSLPHRPPVYGLPLGRYDHTRDGRNHNSFSPDWLSAVWQRDYEVIKLSDVPDAPSVAWVFNMSDGCSSNDSHKRHTTDERFDTISLSTKDEAMKSSPAAGRASRVVTEHLRIGNSFITLENVCLEPTSGSILLLDDGQESLLDLERMLSDELYGFLYTSFKSFRVPIADQLGERLRNARWASGVYGFANHVVGNKYHISHTIESLVQLLLLVKGLDSMLVMDALNDDHISLLESVVLPVFMEISDVFVVDWVHSFLGVLVATVQEKIPSFHPRFCPLDRLSTCFPRHQAVDNVYNSESELNFAENPSAFVVDAVLSGKVICIDRLILFGRSSPKTKLFNDPFLADKFRSSAHRYAEFWMPVVDDISQTNASSAKTSSKGANNGIVNPPQFGIMDDGALGDATAAQSNTEFHPENPLNSQIARVARRTIDKLEKQLKVTIVLRSKNERLIGNLPEIIGAMLRHNWVDVNWLHAHVVYFDHMKFEEQVLLMRDTDVLVAIHGAALLNAIFMERGSAVVEISLSNYDHYYLAVSKLKL